MGALTNTFVDPVGGDDGSGDGTIGTPYKTLQFAWNNTTRDATNGDQFNMKVGGADILSAKLDLTTYGTPTAEAPVVIRGYTSAVNDGGTGDLDGSGSVSIFDNAALSYVNAVDMHCHNCGAAVIWRGGISSLVRCEFDGTTNLLCVKTTSWSSVVGCYVHDFSGVGIGGQVNGEVAYNFVDKSVTGAPEPAIDPGNSCVIHHNIVKLSGAGNSADGIQVGADSKKTFNNSIWSNAGTGQGIIANVDTLSTHIYNNVIEGFSGTGGIGIVTTGPRIVGVHTNAVFNCETAYSLGHDEIFPYGDNETLSASPFIDAANNDFTPADTGNVLTGFLSTFLGPSGVVNSFPVKGAVEPEAIAAAPTTVVQGLADLDTLGG